MPEFIYKARDKEGKLVTNSLEAASEKEIIANLTQSGYSIISISTQKDAGFSFDSFLEQLKRLDKREVIIFTRQLATLLCAGTALSESLSAVCEQTRNKKFKTILEDVSRSVRGGQSFSESLSKYPEAFSELFISMVEVGETGGMLDKVLDRLANLGTQELETASRIRSALIYPVVLVVVAFIIVNFLIVGVLPKFVMIFKASSSALPLPTKIVMGLSFILRRLWLPIVIAGGIMFWWFRNYVRTEKGKTRFHTLLLKLPIFGQLFNKIQVSHFARTLAVLISSGIPLLQALIVVEKTITNVVIRKEVQKIRTSIAEGSSLAEPFGASGMFSPMMVQMISTGEKSGNLDEMLRQVSGFYDPEIEYTIRNLTSLLEPFMLLTMGIMVAFIALSVLLPIFNLIKVFRG